MKPYVYFSRGMWHLRCGNTLIADTDVRYVWFVYEVRYK